ncbi:MAG: M14 family zinc carboxypeptidase [Bacteroidales bacterium]
MDKSILAPSGTYTGLDLPGTRDTIFNPTRVSFNGTDLNRSFPGPIPEDPADDETYNFINFQAERKFVLSMNIHSGYEVVNYPWDTWLSKRHPDDAWFENISRRYADTVHYYSGTGYLEDENDGIVRGSVWYVIYGGRQDYITWAQQGREVTLEIDLTKQTPGAQLPLLWEYNYRSFLRWGENAIYGIHGNVRDQATGDPVAARIYIAGHDADSSHVYSDTLSGRFVRLLSPGTYDLIFTAGGYYPELVSGVAVADFQQTWLNVTMEKDPQSVGEISEDKMRIWPVPAEGEVFIQLPAEYNGPSEITVISLSGKMVLTRNEGIYSSAPLRLSLPKLPPGVYICTLRNLKNGRSVSAPFIVR